MTNAGNIKEQISGSKGLLERIAMYIPGYRGYKQKNVARDTDREVRTAVVRTLKNVKAELGNIHRIVVENGDMNASRDIERLRTKVDTHASKVEKAVSGYSGIWASVKKTGDELDAVIEWDAALLESADSLKMFAESVRGSAENGENVKTMISQMENDVDDVLEKFTQRDAVLKGFTEE
jgi:hypothetical protein